MILASDGEGSGSSVRCTLVTVTKIRVQWSAAAGRTPPWTSGMPPRACWGDIQAGRSANGGLPQPDYHKPPRPRDCARATS